jgi:hypothetical protein
MANVKLGHITGLNNYDVTVTVWGESESKETTVLQRGVRLS